MNKTQHNSIVQLNFSLMPDIYANVINHRNEENLRQSAYWKWLYSQKEVNHNIRFISPWSLIFSGNGRDNW